jgi:hypothetical protein
MDGSRIGGPNSLEPFDGLCLRGNRPINWDRMEGEYEELVVCHSLAWELDKTFLVA